MAIDSYLNVDIALKVDYILSIKSNNVNIIYSINGGIATFTKTPISEPISTVGSITVAKL